jgi:hypothetical protein
MTGILDHIVASTDARATGRDKYLGHCLSHGSKRNRDLSIKLSHDRIFVHCFAGCEPADVCLSMGIHLRDLFLGSKKDPAVIRREHKKREKKKTAMERARHDEGARLDTLREAESLVARARNIDISAWTDSELAKAIDQVADAYDVLATEEGSGWGQ